MEELKYGWCGKILWVDLKNRTSREQDISDLCKEYIGCRGIAAKLCWDYLKPVTGAFDEGNLLMYLAGPCAGTPVLAGGRSYFFGVGAQSYPEMYTRSSLGGRCGAAIKYCGYDGVTGVEYTDEKLEKLSEKIWDMERCYSIREINRTKAYDMQITHCHDSRNGDWTTGTRIDARRFSDLLGRYYALMGWDEEGIPTEEKLLELGLPECNEAMKSHREALAAKQEDA